MGLVWPLKSAQGDPENHKENVLRAVGPTLSEHNLSSKGDTFNLIADSWNLAKVKLTH